MVLATTPAIPPEIKLLMDLRDPFEGYYATTITICLLY